MRQSLCEAAVIGWRALVGVVDFHLGRRKSVLDFIVRLQGQERFILQQWLFNFWVFSYRHCRFVSARARVKPSSGWFRRLNLPWGKLGWMWKNHVFHRKLVYKRRVFFPTSTATFTGTILSVWGWVAQAWCNEGPSVNHYHVSSKAYILRFIHLEYLPIYKCIYIKNIYMYT